MATPTTERAVAKFLAYFEEVKKLHQETLGRPLEMHKATDADCLKQLFQSFWGSSLTGADFVAEMLHRLSWSQCLGNTNHRTTVLFVANFLESAGVTFPQFALEPNAQPRIREGLHEWIQRSQAIIQRRGEPGYA